MNGGQAGRAELRLVVTFKKPETTMKPKEQLETPNPDAFETTALAQTGSEPLEVAEPVLEDTSTFALFGGGVPYSDLEVCSDELCWEVELLWKSEGSAARTLFVGHVGADETLVLGEGGEVELPAAALGAASHTLIDHGVLTMPGGTAEALVENAESSAALGAFELQVRSIRAPKRLVPRLGEVDTKSVGAIAGTMIVAAAFLALFAMLPPTGMAMNHDSHDQRERLAEMMMTVEEARETELEVFEGPSEESSSEAGTAEQGESGAMGSQESEETGRRYAIEGNAQPNERRLSRHEQQEQARTAGIIGVLGGLSAPSPTSVFGAETALGSDPISALGAMTGQEVGSSFGFGGLGLNGIGRQGGGEGLGTIGVMDGQGGIGATCVAEYCRAGQGSTGIGGLGRRARSGSAPRAFGGRSTVQGGLSREVIRRTVQRNIGAVRHCYQQELQSNPSLEGRVAIRFVITPDGSIGAASVGTTTIQNRSVEQCVAGAVRRMGFPQSESPTIVTYPFVFATN